MSGARPGRSEVACPRCEALIAPEQDWCLTCGAPARTRLAPLPNWKLPLGIVTGVLTSAVIALGIAFVALTDDDEPVGPTPAGATGPTGATGVVPPPAVAPPPAAVPPAGTVTGPTGPSGPTG